MLTRPLSIGLLLIVLSTLPAPAAIIHDNGSPIFIGVNITAVRAADDFTLAAPATVTDIRFFGSVFSGTFPANFSGDVAWAIFNDSSGAIGTSVASGAVTGLSGTQTGSFYRVDFQLGAPVALGAGTYWLEIHEGSTLSTNDGSTISWSGLNATAASNALQSTNLANPPSTDMNFELAFQLFDNSTTSSVPEPATCTLLAAPLALLFWFRRRV